MRVLKAYMHEPREQWVQSWPGQVVLCVSQIYWTSHVHATLDGSGFSLRNFWNALQVSPTSFYISVSFFISDV